MYDLEAQKLAIKAIGTVESNLNYASINYNDPITVGFMQWYGTRAAALLGRIRTDNPSSWVGIESSLTDALDSHPATDSQYWTNRYLNKGEGEPLRNVLNENKALQNAVAIEDMEVYKDTATRQGMDADANTNAMIFFFVMYHQSPRRALSVLAAAGPQSDMQRLYASALNEPVLGQYRTRYTTARNIILAADTSGIEDPPGEIPEEPPGGDTGGSTGQVKGKGDVSYVRMVGDQMHIRLRAGRTLVAAPNGSGLWLPVEDAGTGAVVPDLPPETPTPGDPDKGAQLVAWMNERLNRYNYSQGPTRLTPEKNMYTDCSGLVYTAYQEITGINIGTYTGDQYTKGALVTQGSGTLDASLLQPGDLIFYNWVTGRSTVDHVEMYIGGGQICGHPGPGKGPTIKPVTWGIANARNYYVRRHL